MDCTANCVHRQWFQEVFLSPWSDFQYRIMPVFILFQYWPSVLSLAYRYKKTLLNILCTGYDEISKFCAILLWKTLFVHYSEKKKQITIIQGSQYGISFKSFKEIGVKSVNNWRVTTFLFLDLYFRTLGMKWNKDFYVDCRL